MTWPVPFDDSRLNLCTDRVEKSDGLRQSATVREILKRLETTPGLVLADEVGMGKTFVALAVAISAALADKARRPVVIMVPPSLRDKWPRDWDVFRELCLKDLCEKNLRTASARSALDFFRLLDDSTGKRARIIFLTHGAFQNSLNDPWVKLAIIRAAIYGIHLGERREALPRFVATLLRTKSKFNDPDLYSRLMKAECIEWKSVINEQAGEKDQLEDDPVPAAINRLLEKRKIDLKRLTEKLRDLPARASGNIDERLEDIRRELSHAMRDIWPQALKAAQFHSPLLILDEAHHLKNPATRLASLFVDPQIEEETNMLAGALAGGFERMLFLTATPFQLGHEELLHILKRFDGIAWGTLNSTTREAFNTQLQQLGKALDRAQQSTTDLEKHWRNIHWDDIPGETVDSLDTWWDGLAGMDPIPERIQVVRRAYERASASMKEAEKQLQPLVIRHLRSRQLPAGIPRRERLDGRAITTGNIMEREGICIADDAILPFLLAARSQALVVRNNRSANSKSRATFAEGLASSYEAFLETRRKDGPTDEIVDEETVTPFEEDPRLGRYLDKLHKALPSPMLVGNIQKSLH